MESRRLYRQGALYQRSVDGRWYGAVSVATIDGRRRRVTVSGQQRHTVERRLARLIRARREPDLLVGEWLTRWLRDLLPGTVGSPNTLANYSWAIDKHLVPALGHIPLVDLSPADIARFLHAELVAGYALRTVARLRTALNTSLSDAVLHGFLERNPVRLVRPLRGTTETGRSLDLHQAKAVLANAQGERFEAAFVIMLTLGLRPGETLALRWCDIDFEAGVLVVSHSLKRERHGLRLAGTKTLQSRRCLALPDPVVAALLQRHRNQRVERERAGARWEEHDLVFTTRLGRPVDHSALREHLSTVTRRAGLGHWHPHELRHSAVSLLSAAGVRLEDVADVMGHRSTRTTSAVYRHVVVPTINAAVTPVESMFGAASGEMAYNLAYKMAYTSPGARLRAAPVAAATSTSGSGP